MSVPLGDHRPRYEYCSTPELCCGHPWPISVNCAVDGQYWPCDTKRSHHTPAAAAREQRWANSRIARPPRAQESG